MSYATIKIVQKNGDIKDFKDYANAWGGAAYIWSKLSACYLGDEIAWMQGRGEELDKLFNANNIPEEDRITLASTFDRVVIKSERLVDLIAAFQKFHEAHPPGDSFVCHITKWIQDIEGLMTDKDIRGIAFHATSVSEDLWVVEVEEEDDCRPYNIDKDEGHWFLFDEIENTKKLNKKEFYNGH